MAFAGGGVVEGFCGAVVVVFGGGEATGIVRERERGEGGGGHLSLMG